MILKTTALIIALTATTPLITPQDFGTAKKNAENKGKTLVVVVGADWCPACVQMKDNTIQQAAHNGAMKNAEYTYVDFDKNRELAQKLMRGSTIPQLIRFDYKESKWAVQRYSGAFGDVQQVSGFITKR